MLYVDALRPSQKKSDMPGPGLDQYYICKQWIKCLAQGHGRVKIHIIIMSLALYVLHKAIFKMRFRLVSDQ